MKLFSLLWLSLPLFFAATGTADAQCFSFSDDLASYTDVTTSGTTVYSTVTIEGSQEMIIYSECSSYIHQSQIQHTPSILNQLTSPNGTTVGGWSTGTAVCPSCYMSFSTEVSLDGDGYYPGDYGDIGWATVANCNYGGTFYDGGGGGQEPLPIPTVTVNTGGSIPYGMLPDISARVSNNTGPVPTGEVTFSMDPAGVPASEAIPLDNGAASWPLATLGGGPLIPVGAYTVNAAYNPVGDANYAAATGSTTLAVNKANSTSTITNCPANVTAGQSQPFNISVAWSDTPTATGPVQPSGQVNLTASPYSGSATQGGPATLTLFYTLPSTATISITLNAAGVYTVTAAYQGDGNYNPSTSEQCVVTVVIPQG